MAEESDRSTELEAAVERFEDAWKAQGRPHLEDFLPAGPSRRAVLVELAHVDLEYRLRAGEAARAETYLQRYPELGDERRAALDLVAAEYRLRRRRGETVAVEEYAARFPDEAPTLLPLLARQATEDGWPAPPGFTVLGVLGRGGMGVVYRARQENLGRLVALKMISAGAGAGEEERARFRAEAEAVARLQHPNIIQIHEVGEHDGRPFFALEYADGPTLAAHLGGTPRPPVEAARLLETLALAVHHAHERGVIHRDLKPSNVLLAVGGSAGGAKPPAAIPKIADFGLAKRLDVDRGQTQAGVILGTPSYMAPEQARGQRDGVGPAADVYSLGAVLYECLTGRPPFRGPTPLDTVAQVLHGEPVPPRTLQPLCPRDLETICLKCLEKEPSSRYPGAQALADDLRRFLDGKPTWARPVGPLGRVRRWGRRNPLAAALLLGLFAALLGALWQTGRAEQARARAEGRSQLALEAADTLVSGIVDGVRPVAGSQAPHVKDIVTRVAPVFDRLLAADDRPAARASKARMGTALAELWLDLNDSAAALASAREAVALFEELTREAPAEARYAAGLGRAYQALGAVYLEQGRLAPTRDAFERSLAVRRRLHEQAPDDVEALGDLFSILHARASLLWELQDQDGSRAAGEEALRLAKRLIERQPDEPRWRRALATAHEKVADALYEDSDADGAVRAYDEALTRYEELAARFPTATGYARDLARVYQQQAGVFSWKGDAALMSKRLDAARAVAERLVQGDPANVLWRRLLLGCRLKQILNDPARSREKVALCREMEALVRAYAEQDPPRARWRADWAALHIMAARARLELAAAGDDPHENSARALDACRAGQEMVAALASQDPDNATHADKLFVLHWYAGQALTRLGKTAESADAARQAWQFKRERAGRLAALYPGVARWEQERAESLRYVGLYLARLAELKVEPEENLRQARRVLDEAIPAHLALLDRDPGDVARLRGTAEVFRQLAALASPDEAATASARETTLNGLADTLEKAATPDRLACRERLYDLFPGAARAAATASEALRRTPATRPELERCRDRLKKHEAESDGAAERERLLRALEDELAKR